MKLTDFNAYFSSQKTQHVHDLICKTFSFAAYTKYISVSPQICEGHNYAANSIHVDCTLNLGFHSCGCGIWNTEMEQRKYRLGEIMWISYLIPMKYNSNCYLKSNYIFCICVEKTSIYSTSLYSLFCLKQSWTLSCSAPLSFHYTWNLSLC